MDAWNTKRSSATARRYDLVIDDGGRLARVQCKTSRLREGAVRFNTCSSYAHQSNPRAANRDYIGQVDYFAVHCSETEGVYLVPIEDLPTKRLATLRIARARNSQTRGIRPAAKYRVATVNVVASSELAGRAGAGALCA